MFPQPKPRVDPGSGKTTQSSQVHPLLRPTQLAGPRLGHGYRVGRERWTIQDPAKIRQLRKEAWAMIQAYRI